MKHDILSPKRKIILATLFTAAILIELLNIFLAFHMSTIESISCPKHPSPFISILLTSVLSVVLIIIAGFIANRYKHIVFLIALFWAVFLVVSGTFLVLLANGGFEGCGLVL